MKHLTLTIVKAIVPDRYHHLFRTLQPQGTKPHRRLKRKGVVRYHIQDNVYINVFWVVLRNERFPRAALYVYEDEFLKFDCYGRHPADFNGGSGHYHILLGKRAYGNERLFLPEKTVEEQIERTVFELTVNSAYYLQRHSDPRIRTLTLDPGKLTEVVERVRQKMLEFYKDPPTASKE